MNSTPLKALCLVEWLNDESDSNSESSSEEVIEAHNTEASAKVLDSTTSRDLYNQRGEQEPDVIVISSGEESSDLDNEAEDDTKDTAAEATTSELLLQDNNHNNDGIRLLGSTSLRHATPPAESRLPVEIDGIFATAIEELEANDNESIQNIYQTLAFVEQQEERDRQRRASTLGGEDQQTSPLQRVDSGVDAIVPEGEPECMDTMLDCRSLERAELEKSRAAMAMDGSRACKEQVEVREERQENLHYERQKPEVQLSERIHDTSDAAHPRRGVLQKQDRIKTGRIVKLTKKQKKALAPRSELSGRNQLLNLRSKLAAGSEHATASRSLDPTVKTKLARRNKQVRRNKQKKQKHATGSRV